LTGTPRQRRFTRSALGRWQRSQGASRA
jgi:hypothetical protein